jgi:uncharacterized protein YceH (UPF0502 family)
MHPFDDTGEVETVLERLMERTPDPLVMRLARRPGEKEVRFTHLLSGAPAIEENETQPASAVSPPRADRVGELEAEVARLRDELESLKAQFAQFRRQFE